MVQAGSEPLVNHKHELYCQARLQGMTQSAAMLEAYPTRKHWKADSVKNKACALERERSIQARITYLKREAAQAAIISRAELLAGMSDAFQESRKTMKTDGLSRDTILGISNIGRLLIESLPEEHVIDELPFVRDFGTLISEPFFSMHRRIARDEGGDFWLYGGRASTKSSCISLEIVNGLMTHTDRSAFVMVKRRVDIREGVYEQMLWALRMLGVADEWTCTVSPLRMTRKTTGQAIIFRGGDNTEKTKAVKAPSGTYFSYLWIEEADQFSGMNELRTIYQSVTRDAGPDAVYYRFHSFNPPRSRKSWANEQIQMLQAQGTPVYRANYNDVPPEWVPSQIYEDAERLKAIDPQSYAHEYLGEPVGFGNEVFERVEVREITPHERANLEYHYYGLDWGFARDPLAWVKIAYDAKSRTLYILDELVGCGMSNVQSAELIASRMNTPLKHKETVIEDAEPYAVVWCDSAEPKSIADYRECGINAKGAVKQGIHNVRNSIKWLQCRTKIVIDKNCTHAAGEFSTYSYELTQDGEPTGNLPDIDNHTIDAVRYACTTLINDRGLL